MQRSKRGNFLVETPIALFIFLFLFVFPFLDLAAITLRTTFLYAAAHNAAWEAARAHTYQNSLDGLPSAVQLANSVAQKTAAPFAGIKINSIKTNILTTDIRTLNQARQSAPLQNPAERTV